jgi:hypothetical protein
LPPAKQLQVGTHRAGAGGSRERSAVLLVGSAEALRQQQLHWLAEQVLSRVAKEHLGLVVDEDDTPLLVRNQGRIGGQFHEGTEALLSLPVTPPALPALYRLGAFFVCRPALGQSTMRCPDTPWCFWKRALLGHIKQGIFTVASGQCRAVGGVMWHSPLTL